MSFYRPKAILALRLILEDNSLKSDVRLQRVYEMNVRPRRVTVNINDYTQADVMSAEIDFKQFPFDPRTIRALGVTVHMEDTKEILATSNANALFIGFADEQSIDLDENSRTVKFEGRDFTALLLDAPYPNTATVKLTDALDVIVKRIVKELPATADVQVVNRTGISTLPVLAKFAPDFTGTLNPGQKNVKKGETYWEVIQDLVSRAGLIAYIELDKLIISKPRVVYNNDIPIQFLYGRNLKKLTFKRKIGRQKSMNIRVLSLDPSTKTVIEALVPEQAEASWCQEMGIKKEQIKIKKLGANNEPIEEPAPYIGFRLPNITNQAHLIRAAQEIFEEIGRQQLEGSLETKEMQVAQRTPVLQKFDILKLRNGTPVAIDIEQPDMLQMDKSKSLSERTQYLIDRGYESNVAGAIAAAYGKMGIFYTKAVEFTLDEDGFSLDLNFINLIQLPPRLLT